MLDFSFLKNPSIVGGFISGTGFTILVAFIGVLIGIVIGMLLAIGKIIGNKFVRGLCTVYINFIRSTPLLIQLYLIYYVTPFIAQDFNISIQMSGLLAGIVAVGLNSGAYVAEIFRAGIMSVDKGQFEAARSLGLNYKQTLAKIIVPQAIKNILPALGNEFTTVIKESAIISIVGAKDLMFYANQLRNITYNPFAPLFVAAIIYFIVVFSLTKLVSIWERKLQND
ncbi:amino acid ABC transporter permease [Mycoplasma sp. P36-A1]|uniref:amino acid ABC transporter permease n=1 Tax=Mycoplasma sp. P36-A1 TaxID=3252900 RepID=UPI003C30896F